MNRHAKRGLCAEWNNAEPFFSVRTMWLAGSQFPDQGLTLGRDNDELRILTTRPPGTSQRFYFFKPFPVSPGSVRRLGVG